MKGSRSPSPETAKPSPSIIGGEGASISIETGTSGDQNITIIFVEGEIKLGDQARFADAALNVKGTSVVAVMLNSLGGNLLAGIEIGEAIRIKGFRTIVADGSTCASACALAWLGGRPRLMEPGARIGFHAAYIDDPEQSITGLGNALVGAYLNKLNLSDDAIVYMTKAQPSGMQWLTLADAARIGLEVKELTFANSGQ